MKRLIAYVSGNVQKVGYRAKVIDIARAFGIKGTIENLSDGRVKIIAEGDDEKLKWFESAIDIKNTLVQVSSIDKRSSQADGEFSGFNKIVEKEETDSRLDKGIEIMTKMLVAIENVDKTLCGVCSNIKDVNKTLVEMNSNLGGKMDQMLQKQDIAIQKQDQMLSKQDVMIQKRDQMLSKQDVMIQKRDQMLHGQDVMIQKQDQMLHGQDDLLVEVKDMNRNLGDKIDKVLDKSDIAELKADVSEVKAALRAKGII